MDARPTKLPHAMNLRNGDAKFTMASRVGWIRREPAAGGPLAAGSCGEVLAERLEADETAVGER